MANRAQLERNSVHVWHADVARVPPLVLELLPADELRRAEAIVDPRRRALWARARGLLRSLLGEYLDEDPRALRFEYGPHGKPAIEMRRPRTRGTRPALAFNLAHSRALAVYALSRAGDVGVDVESCSRPVDGRAIARLAQREGDAATLRPIDTAARAAEFRRIWVRHEAALKLRGDGIWSHEAPPFERTAWVRDLDLGRDAAAAIALAREPSELVCAELSLARCRASAEHDSPQTSLLAAVA
jgi:4'-phosphopantetheinyl transferase